MSVEIEGLEFQIESNSEQAAKGVDSLATSFTKLKKALNGNALEKAGKNLKTIGDLNLNMSGVEKITNLTESMSKLSEIKISSTVPKRLTEIGTALDSITESGVERVEALTTALEKLQSTQIPNMSTLGQTGTSSAGTGAVDTANTGAATSEIENYNSSVSQAAAQTSRLRTILNGIGGVFSKAFSIGSTALKGFLNIIGKGVGSVKSLVNQTKKLGSTIGSKLSAKVKQATSGFGNLFSSIKRIAMYRLIRSFFSQLTNAMKEGINNLYQYSALMGTTFKGSMDSLATSFQYLKNSMGAMVSPIINSLAPAIDFLIDKFVNLLNIVNQFFARLTGATTYTAAKKAATSYADTLGDTASAATDAAKEIKDATTGIDELNIISQDDDSGSGSGSGSSGTDYGSMFETLPIDSTISDFVDKLKEAFEAGDWEELGTLLGEKFNEIVDSVDWSGIGSKIGYGINGAVQTAYYFLKTADFTNLGNHVAELLNSALGEIDFTYVGRLWIRSMTAALDFFIGLLGGLDWGLIGTSVGDFLRGAFDEISDWISDIDWGAMADSLYENIKKFLTGIDFASLAQSFFTMLGKALAAAVSFIATFVSDVIEDIKEYFLKYIEDENGDGKFGGLEIVEGLLKGIWEGIKNIGTWIKENVFDPFIEGFKSVFGIHSPSTVMQEIGEMVVQGFLNGLNLFSNIASKVKEWAGKVVEWFTKGSDGKGIVENFKTLASNVVSGFKEKVGSTYTTVKTNVTTWASKVKDWFSSSSFGGINASTFTTFASNTIEGFKTKIGNAYTNVKSNVTTWASKVKDWFTNSSFGGVNSTTFSTYANNTIEGFKTKIGSAYTNVKSNVTTWAGKVKEWFTSSSYGNVNNSAFQTFANNTIEGFKSKIGSAYTNTKSNITTWATKVKDWFTGSGYGAVNNSTFQTYANNVIEGFKSKIGSAYTNTQTNITTWATKVKSWFSDIASSSAFSGFANDVINGFKNKIGSAYTNAQSNVETWAKKVKTWFTDINTDSAWSTIAKNTIQGFANGITTWASECKSAVQSWGASVLSWFKDKLEIESPSKMFYSFGEFTVAGFNNAITEAGKTTKGIVNKWTDSFTNVSPTLALAVDTSALSYYDSDAFARSVSANVSNQYDVYSDSLADALDDFYSERVEPALNRIVTATETQADKQERTVVQVGSRTITDEVKRQEKANGYSFTK